MTFVGRILVLVIMALALLFLGVTTVVFSTATNWKEETKKQKDIVTKLQGETNTLRSEVRFDNDISTLAFFTKTLTLLVAHLCHHSGTERLRVCLALCAKGTRLWLITWCRRALVARVLEDRIVC